MNDVWRYETKIVAQDCSMSTILNEIYLNPLMFRPLFKPRIVNNLYFDSLGYDHFYDHVYGYGKRNKVRLRWYGDFKSVTKPVLEIKRKWGTVGSKMTYPVLDEMNLDKHISLISISKKTSIPLYMREHLSHLVPSLFNRYYREYFISADQKVRLTVDSHIEHKSVESLMWRKEPDSLRIIEFKYNQSEFFEGERALKNFSFVQDKSSKYIRGLLRIT